MPKYIDIKLKSGDTLTIHEDAERFIIVQEIFELLRTQSNYTNKTEGIFIKATEVAYMIIHKQK